MKNFGKRMLVLFAMVLMAVGFTACDDGNVDLQAKNKVCEFAKNDVVNVQMLEENVSAADEVYVFIYLKDLKADDDFKSKYDWENLTAEEIDRIIKEDRTETKKFYTEYNNNFISSYSINDLNGNVECSQYAPLIIVEYKNYKILEQDLGHINQVLAYEPVNNLVIYVD